VFGSRKSIPDSCKRQHQEGVIGILTGTFRSTSIRGVTLRASRLSSRHSPWLGLVYMCARRITTTLTTFSPDRDRRRSTGGTFLHSSAPIPRISRNHPALKNYLTPEVSRISPGSASTRLSPSATASTSTRKASRSLAFPRPWTMTGLLYRISKCSRAQSRWSTACASSGSYESIRPLRRLHRHASTISSFPNTN